MQRNKWKVWLLIVGIAMAAPVHAESNSAEEIARISEEIAVLQTKLRKIEVETQIAQKQSDLSRLSGSSSTLGSSMPTVRGIEGLDGKLRATFAFGGGITQAAAKGDMLTNGWKVESIESSAVTLSRGRERRRVPFGNEPSAQSGLQSSSIPPSLPGMR